MRLHGVSLIFYLSTIWVFLLILPSESFLNDEVLALRAFKQAINEDPLSKLADWNTLSGNPCTWNGVACSQNQVSSIKLSNSSLKGFLAPEIGMLNSLQELVLDNNFLVGTIPKQIGRLKNLRVLDLSKNQFLGPIPAEIGRLTNIMKINLQFNELTGSLPPELSNLVSLSELRLNRNNLSGIIPANNKFKSSSKTIDMYPSENLSAGLCQLPQLQIADFSYNFFTGKIPPCLKHLPRSSFQINCLQDKDYVLQRPTTQCISVKGQDIAKDTALDSHDKHKRKKRKEPKWLLILEVVTGAVVFVFLVSCAFATFKRCKPKSSIIIPCKRNTNWKDEMRISIDNELLKDVTKLSRQELEIACEDFSNIIGSSPDSKNIKEQ